MLTIIMLFGIIGPANVYAVENTSVDSYGELLADGLTEGRYVDSTAQNSEQYEYTVVGSDGSVATVDVDETNTIRLQVGESITVDGLVEGSPSVSEIVRVRESAQYEQIPATSFVSGANYLITTVDGQYILKNNPKPSYGTWAPGLTLRLNDYSESWKVIVVNSDEENGVYEVNFQDEDGKYMTFANPESDSGANTAVTMEMEPQVIDLTRKEEGMYSISYTSSNSYTTYLNNLGGKNTQAAGWSSGNVTNANGWRFYKESGSTILTGQTEGNTTVVIGGKTYQIEVYSEDVEIPEGIAKTVNYKYVLVTIGEGKTVQPGTYMIMNSRYHRALVPGENKHYLQVVTEPTDYSNEKPQAIIELTEEQSTYKVDWEISKDGNNYYLKYVGTDGYLTFTDGANTVSATSTEDNKVATSISPYLGGEAHGGAVVIGQGNVYLNMHGGTGGSYGGYSQSDDGGAAIYLYEKLVLPSYEIDVAELQTLVDGYNAENLEEADYTPDSWTAYAEALAAVETLLAQTHGFATLDEAVADKVNVDAAYQTLEAAKTALTEDTSGNISLPDGKLPLEYLYEVICQANGGQFLYSEEVYTPESGIAYRDALKKARGTFENEEAAIVALGELEAAVRGLETVADSCFPEIEWSVTNDANRTTGNTTQSNFVPNVTYLNTTDKTLGEITYDEWEALTWEWSAISRLVNDEDERVAPVWSQGSNGMWGRTYDGWTTNDDWTLADVYKISGTFVWPEGYDLNDTTVVLDSKNDFFYRDIYEYISDEGLSEYFPLGQVLPVNDDVYVVMWAGDEAPTLPTADDDGINNYMVFWSGTSGKGYWTEKGMTANDWNRQEPATFIEWNLQGERAFRNSYPNKIGTGETKADGSAYSNSDVEYLTTEEQKYLSHTDGWYTLTDTTAINSVLRSNYPDGIAPGTKVHIDLYVMNNSREGMIDQLEIELFKEKEEETEVIINYYLNEVSEDGYLGTETLLNQSYGTSISLLNGTGAGQLNSYKAEAIYQAGYKDVTDGVQLNNPLIVTRDGENVIDVLYTVKGNQSVILTAPSDTIPYDGQYHTLNTVAVTEINYTDAGIDQDNGVFTLPDGNTIYNVYSYVSQKVPGIYSNNFVMQNGSSPSIVVRDTDNVDVTNTYSISKIPGTLTITTNTVDEVYVYDFGVANTYTDVLKNDVDANVAEDLATTVSVNSDTVTFDKDANTITYTPSSVNTGETVTLTLEYAGGYTVTKTIQFVPANNVLYEESFVTAGEGWTVDGTALDYEVIDTEDADWGYTEYGHTVAYEGDDVWEADALAYSNGAALTAELTLENGASTVESESKATFTFTGTGFDLISTCGEDTGLLLAVLKQDGKAVKSYFVDTYFVGDVANEEEGEEAIASGAAYQIPVIRDTELAYGTYTVDVYGYLVNTAGAGAAAASMFMMDDMMPVQQMAVSKEEILMAALQDLELEDVVDMATVDISYMDDNSVLNGGTGGVEIAGNVAMFALTDEVAAVDDTPTSFTGYVAVDAFRVYQPLETEPEAYVENDVKFASVYDFVQTSINDLEGEVDDVAVYLEYDGNTAASSIADYKNQGPQNEVYLAPGCAVAFAVVGYEEGDVLQVSAKAVTKGATPDFTGELTGTEMYYDITSLVTDASELGEGVSYVVIRNDSGDGILSISELKMSSGISVLASAELGEKVESELNVDNSAFKPEALTATLPSTAKKNRNFVLKFSGSTDIAELYFAKDETSEGTLVQATNTKAVASGKADLYTYSQTVKETAEGTYTYYVYAVNAEGIASERVPVTVTVQ